MHRGSLFLEQAAILVHPVLVKHVKFAKIEPELRLNSIALCVCKPDSVPCGGAPPPTCSTAHRGVIRPEPCQASEAVRSPQIAHEKKGGHY